MTSARDIRAMTDVNVKENSVFVESVYLDCSNPGHLFREIRRSQTVIFSSASNRQSLGLIRHSHESSENPDGDPECPV